MSKRVYISADYDPDSGDRNVVNELYKWSASQRYSIEFTDMAKVVSGSIANDPDCRICDLKAEFNTQINLSSAVIFVVGDKTASRTAGSKCERLNKQRLYCRCTPYKQNANGTKSCKHSITYDMPEGGDVGNINTYSYLRHEFEQAKKKGKKIIVIYNSLYKQPQWLPWYMSDYKDEAFAFWKTNAYGSRVGNYALIKEALDA